MLVANRLIRLVETHSDELAKNLLETVQRSPYTRSYRNVPCEELQQRVYEIYQHLGEWLSNSTDGQLEERYREIGARRFKQGIALSELIWAITLTRQNLLEFLVRDAFPDSALEVFGELELVELLGQFFDRAAYYAAKGYEQQALHSVPGAKGGTNHN